MTRRRSASGGFLLFAIVAAMTATAASPTVLPEVNVQSVLKSLQGSGLEIIYSSDLVPPELVAPAPNPDASPLQRAAEVLAPHELALRAIGVSRFIVVKVERKQVAVVTAQPEPVLEEVSVYGSRFAMQGGSSREARLLASTDIQAVPGTHDDPLRALRSLPGLATTVSARPYIRGSLSNDVLVRYDGVTLLDPYHLKGFQSLFGAIDPLAVESMEVFSSGYPVRYGTRSGGVIDIAPPSHIQEDDFALTLSKLSVGGAISGKSERLPLEWLVTLRRNTTDMLLSPFDAERESPRVVDATGLLRWKVNDHSDWSAGWLLLDDRLDVGDVDAGETAQARYRDEYGWLAFRHRSGGWQSRTTLAFAHAERTRQGAIQQPGIADGQVAENRHYRNAELASDWSYESGAGLSANLGAALAASGSEYDYTRSISFDPGVAAAFSRPTTDNIAGSGAPKATTVAAYGSLRRSWSALEAEIGIRLDGQDYRGYSSRWQFSPRTNLRYDLTDQWHLYGSIGRFTQAQGVDEWRVEELQQRADPAQSAVHTVAGIAYNLSSDTRWTLEVYRKRWKVVSPYLESLLDPLALLPELSPDRVRIAPDNSEASGIELSVRSRFTGRLRGWASVTVAQVTDEFAGSEQLRSWDQPQALNAGLAWTGVRSELSVMAGWHAGWPHTPVSTDGSGGTTLEIGPRNSARWHDYLTVDVRGSWTRPALGGELTAFAEITNATDRHNPCCTDLVPASNGPPVVQIRRASWLPLILNLGVTIHWRPED